MSPFHVLRMNAQIFTNDAANLAQNLSKDISKTSAIEFAVPRLRFRTRFPCRQCIRRTGPPVHLGSGIR